MMVRVWVGIFCSTILSVYAIFGDVREGVTFESTDFKTSSCRMGANCEELDKNEREITGNVPGHDVLERPFIISETPKPGYNRPPFEAFATIGEDIT